MDFEHSKVYKVVNEVAEALEAGFFQCQLKAALSTQIKNIQGYASLILQEFEHWHKVVLDSQQDIVFSIVSCSAEIITKLESEACC